MNLIIHEKESDTITYFIENCIKIDQNFTGTNIALGGAGEHCFDYIWTEDTVNPVFDENEIQTGWDKTVSEITPAALPGIELKSSNKTERLEATGRLQWLASKDYSAVDTYIDNNITNLTETKDYLKQLSKIVLAVIKIMDKKI